MENTNIDNNTTATVNVEELQKQIEELTSQNKNLKTTLSERNSEAAQRKRDAEEWKNKYESTLSDQELAEAKRKEETAEMAAKLQALERTNAINEAKAQFLSQGYPEELASSSAEAWVDGNKEVVFANNSMFIKQVEENTKAEMLKAQPGISSGKPLSTEDVEKKRSESLLKYAGLI